MHQPGAPLSAGTARQFIERLSKTDKHNSLFHLSGNDSIRKEAPTCHCVFF